ncbi:MAG: hypothetical protein IPI06_10905 [Gammaproteobacteria bacterium]|nr:hypothetical protein [Gammaproteobacteria bacterium]
MICIGRSKPAARARTVLVWIVLAVIALFTATPGRAALPPALEGWRDWALHGQEFRRCPFLVAATPGTAGAHRCAWPGALELEIEARGGRFEQRWQLYAEGWVVLPGSLDHWPRDVRVDGAAAALVGRDGLPQLRLGPGLHTISGRFTWTQRPERLTVPVSTGIVRLTVDGRRVVEPERPDGALWLGRRARALQPEQLELHVYRLIEDQVPVRLHTLLQLRVAGEAREELLGPVLPGGFVPLGLDSQLPVKLETDGRLRVQLRPGSWQITLAARGTGVATSLARPAVQGAPWPREEVWSFAGEDRLRIAAAEGVQGAEGIDPAQAGVPDDWRGFPAFRMSAQSGLRIVERSRGLENVDDNRLSLRRRLWLDFDHGGFTAVDEIRGTLRRDWRLDMSAPYRLESARLGDETLLVTKSASPGARGVELRTPVLTLSSVARTAQTRGVLPATGWQTRFEQVHGELHLPPGHRLLAVWGADSAPGSWWARWGLWNLFGVLIVVVFVAWVAGRAPAALALVALLLTYQESPQHIWLWANLIAAIAVARAAPEGRLRRTAAAWRTASFVVLGIVLLPLFVGQLRLALYPQLDAGAAIPAPAQTEIPALREAVHPAAVPAAVLAASSAEKLQERVSRSVPPEPLAPRYAPGTLLQTGPGLPDWRFIAYSFSWSGPVEPAQSVRFIYVGPLMLALWRITGVVLLAALFVWLARLSVGWRIPLPGGWRAGRGVQTALPLVVLLAGGAWATRADAQSTPDPALLAELRTRLTAPPACLPSCADLSEARVRVTPERLEMALQASVLATVALAVPHGGDRWQIEEVSVDGHSQPILGREGDGRLWIPLEPGAHLIRLAGALAAAESVQLAFPQVPHAVSVEAQGWEVGGVSEGRLVAGSLELTRRRAASEATGPTGTASEFTPFVRVTREFSLGLDWSVTTTVERLAPVHAAFSLEVPLVAGESVLTEGLELHDRQVLVGLGAGEQRLSWTSSLAHSDSLQLGLPAGTARTEVWRLRADPQWHPGFAGLPAVLPEDIEAGSWVWEFHPRPGEQLTVRVLRPEPAPGRTLAIDSVAQALTVGRRSTTAHLEFTYRSTQGGRHAITLPEEARVTSVTLDGAAIPLRPEKGELSLSLLPGTHAVSVEWTLPHGARLRTRSAPVDLHAPSSNLRTTLALPADRWPLAAFGRGVGPAVLYWGELVVLLAVAWLLGRWTFSPLRGHEWLLLGLGLSTLSWGVLALVALWLFALRWREHWQGARAAWRFNVVQLALAFFTLIAVSTLVFSGIRYGLLASPDMGVVGPGSAGDTFSWFVDRSEGPLPQPVVLSVPLWVYRSLMFAWALWIAIALTRWLRWAWKAWTANGFWRGGRLASAPKQ